MRLPGWRQDAVQGKLGIRRRFRRGVKRAVEPFPQIAIRKEVPPQQRHQIGDGPPPLGTELQIADDEHRDQGGPNLNAHGVGAGADKGFYLELLLEQFEEQLNLPALLVDGSDRGGGQLEVVRQQHQFLLLIRQPDGHTAQIFQVRSARHPGLQADNLIPANQAAFGNRQGLDPRNVRVVFEPGDEEHPLPRPLGKELIIHVAPVHRHDASPWKIKGLGHRDVRRLALGDMPEDGQITVVIQQQVQLHRALGLTEMGPVKHVRAQFHGRAVQRQQLVFEAEFLLRAQGLAFGQQIMKEPFKQFPGAVGIGIGEGGAFGGLSQPQMLELALA